MIEVEIALVAAQVILLLVSDKGLFLMAVPCGCPSEKAAMDRKEKEKNNKKNKAFRFSGQSVCSCVQLDATYMKHSTLHSFSFPLAGFLH